MRAVQQVVFDIITGDAGTGLRIDSYLQHMAELCVAWQTMVRYVLNMLAITGAPPTETIQRQRNIRVRVGTLMLISMHLSLLVLPL